MSGSTPSPRALKRALKELNAREQLASTWLVRLGLFLALASWAYDEYYADEQLLGDDMEVPRERKSKKDKR
ncbi:hypothetical protein JCM3770_005053 [Rhodotorula araucariae]